MGKYKGRGLHRRTTVKIVIAIIVRACALTFPAFAQEQGHIISLDTQLDRIDVFQAKTTEEFRTVRNMGQSSSVKDTNRSMVSTAAYREVELTSVGKPTVAGADTDVLSTFDLRSGRLMSVWLEPCSLKAEGCNITTSSFIKKDGTIAKFVDFIDAQDGRSGKYILEQDGLLTAAKYFFGVGYQDKNSPQFGVVAASSMFLVSPGVVALSALGRSQVFLYSVSEDGKFVSLPDNSQLPNMGTGFSSMTSHPSGIIGTELATGSIWYVPSIQNGFDWENAKVIFQIDNLVRATSDKQGRLLATVAGNSSNPSKVIMVNFSTGKVTEIASGNGLDISFSSMGGVAARNGNVYVISNLRDAKGALVGNQILRYNVDTPNHPFVFAKFADMVFQNLKVE